MADILVLDDEKGMRQFLEIMLEKEGYTVTLASNQDEALNYIGKNLYDLVISDLRLKEGNGLNFIEKLKETSPSTFFIIITAYATLDTALKAIKLGAFDYILKPFKVDILRKRIKDALEKKNLVEENLYLRNRDQKDNIINELIFKEN